MSCSNLYEQPKLSTSRQPLSQWKQSHDFRIQAQKSPQMLYAKGFGDLCYPKNLASLFRTFGEADITFKPGFALVKYADESAIHLAFNSLYGRKDLYLLVVKQKEARTLPYFDWEKFDGIPSIRRRKVHASTWIFHRVLKEWMDVKVAVLVGNLISNMDLQEIMKLVGSATAMESCVKAAIEKLQRSGKVDEKVKELLVLK